MKAKDISKIIKVKIVTKQKTFKIECNDDEVKKIFEIITSQDWFELEGAIINTKEIIYAMVI